MPLGVSFDPSQRESDNPADPNARKRAPQQVQKAIQYLALRLPKVVGARSPLAPGLLAGAGAQGPSPHVDTIVNQVLSKVLGPSAGSGGSTEMDKPGQIRLDPREWDGTFNEPNHLPYLPVDPPGPWSDPPHSDEHFILGDPVLTDGPHPGQFVLGPGGTGQTSPIFNGGGWEDQRPAGIGTNGDPNPYPQIGTGGDPNPLPPAGPNPLPPAPRAPTPTPRFSMSGAAPEPDPQPYGNDARPHELPMPMPPAAPPQNPMSQQLLEEAKRRVGTGGDWNQYQTMDDPFVKLFAQTFGRGDWNALK